MMYSTAEITEIMQIIRGTHGDPHHILGLHEIVVKENGQDALVVRAFNPHAKSVKIVDPNDVSFCRELGLVHEDGFFEAVILDRDKWFRYKLRFENAVEKEGVSTVWETYDPYSFSPVLTEFDLQLFGEGTHYKVFDKLGSHRITVDGVEGVHFAVWAPNAQRVSVIGEFNNWDGRRSLMRVLGRGGVWELFIPGLAELDKYKYEIVSWTGSKFEKFDPYAHYQELRPGTCSYIYNIDKYSWHDGDWLNRRADLNVPMNIYEVHLGSWRRPAVGGESTGVRPLPTYAGITDELIQYVKEMGYTHIELMPVMEHPFDGSWGYQVTGYYAPTSRYGEPVHLMALIDKCHQNGIGVILDWVPAHFANDSYALAKYDGNAIYEHEDPRRGLHPQWGTLIFNYGRGEVKSFLIGNALFWLEKYHADGLRVDGVSSMLYLDYGREGSDWVANKYGGKENLEAIEFIKHMNSITAKLYPGTLLIAEESTSWANVTRSVEKDGLGFNLKWNMGQMNDFLFYISKEPIYRRYHHNNLTFNMMYAYSENFILVFSHDEVVHGKSSLISKMPGDLWQKFANLKVSLGFMFSQPGKKLMFMGGEFGQFSEWSESKQLDWYLLENESHRQLQSFARDLNHLYKNERALWFDDFTPNGFEWIDCNDADKSQLSMIRKTDNPNETLVILCNFTPVPIMEHKIGVPYNFKYKEILNSDDRRYGGGGLINGTLFATREETNNRPLSLTLNLPPLSVVILRVEP